CAPGPAVSRLKPLELRRPVLVLVEDGQLTQHAAERRLDLPPPARHPERPALDDEHGVVTVHDEPGQAIRLAPHEAAERGRPGRFAGGAAGDGVGQAPLEKGRVERLVAPGQDAAAKPGPRIDRKSTRLNSSHVSISYAVFCLKQKTPALARLPCAPPTAAK